MIKFSRYIPLALLLAVLVIATSCSNTRYLADDESLYIGSKVQVLDSAVAGTDKKTLEKQLEEAVRPKPNSSFLGIRFKLTLYNLAGVPKKEKGLRNWLRNKIGEPPVLGTDVSVDANNNVLENVLQNQGFLRAESVGIKETKNKKTKAIFEVTAGPRLKIKELLYEPSDTSVIAGHIRSTNEKSLVKAGDYYNLDAIKDERIRIDNVLKNIGYYYFSPDYILMDVDTGIGNNEADVVVKLKYNEMPRTADKQYVINKVTILPNYRLSRTSGSKRDSTSAARAFGRKPTAADTVYYDNFIVVDRQKLYRPSVFYQAMQLDPGEYYSKKDQNLALNRLVTMGAFKFVKNEFTPMRDSNNYRLNVTYLLTPFPRKGFNIDFGGFTQNDSRGGLRGTISWRNRNIFKGAELFTVKLTGGFEAQYGGVSERPNSYNFGAEANLNVPRFMVPFIRIKPSGMYIPRTIFSAGYNYSLRAGFYEINSANFSFGYNWKEDAMKDHKLFPINITLVRTDTFNKEKARSFDFSNLIYNGIIFGPTYEYTYNSQLSGLKRRNNFYFSGLLDLSGNLVGLAQNASYDNPKKIFGSDYAQYIKTQLDFRYYRQLTPGSVLATRFLVGYGYAYGNSYGLPNVKRFFSGGSASLRGFSSRLVGPGTYNQQYLNDTNRKFEILGDVKTELSLEYRARLYKFIEGAVFADAGNIWLLRDDPAYPGGTLSNSFYKELAVDMGVGLRLDFSILLLRFDFAIPVRKPWYPEGERWKFNDIQFGDPDWRRENLFFNLAIGYPF